MLNNEWPISNIFHKLRTKTSNSKKICLTNSATNVFDKILQEHPDFIILDKDNLSNNNKLYDFSYDYIFFNNLMLESSMLRELNRSNIDIVAFNHDDLTKTKREDVHIINNNVLNNNIIVINFNRKSDSLLQNSHNIEYGMPIIDIPEKTKNILVINREKDNMLTEFFQQIKQHDENSDMVSELGNDIKSITDTLSPYKVVIDLESKITLLLSVLCKCNTVTSLDTSDSLLYNHVVKFGEFQNPFECINYAMTKQPTDISDLYEKYNIDQFNNNLNKIL